MKKEIIKNDYHGVKKDLYQLIKNQEIELKVNKLHLQIVDLLLKLPDFNKKHYHFYIDDAKPLLTDYLFNELSQIIDLQNKMYKLKKQFKS